jgi:hypothetical protein
MGKIFGAAIDMLLAPLTPIFNLIMMFLMQLFPVIQQLAVWIQGVVQGFQEGGLAGGLSAFFGGTAGAGGANIAGPMLTAALAAGGAGLLGKLLTKGAGLPLLGGMLGKAGGVLGTVGKFAGPVGLAAGGALMATDKSAGGLEKGLGFGMSIGGGAWMGGIIGSMIAPGIGTAIGAGIGALAGWLGPFLYNKLTEEHSPSMIDQISAHRVAIGKVSVVNPSGGNGGSSMMINQTNNFSVETVQRIRPEEFSPMMEKATRDMTRRQLIG